MDTTKHLRDPSAVAPPPPAFDEDGFLIDPNTWTKATSRLIAKMDGIGPLLPDHWAIIFYLREAHLSNGTLPPMSHVCRVSHLPKHAVRELFGGCREAWRTAGLPNPGEEANSYMD